MRGAPHLVINGRWKVCLQRPLYCVCSRFLMGCMGCQGISSSRLIARRTASRGNWNNHTLIVDGPNCLEKLVLGDVSNLARFCGQGHKQIALVPC